MDISVSLNAFVKKRFTWVEYISLKYFVLIPLDLNRWDDLTFEGRSDCEVRGEAQRASPLNGETQKHNSDPETTIRTQKE